jgi:hypothetical protein
MTGKRPARAPQEIGHSQGNLQATAAEVPYGGRPLTVAMEVRL